MGGRRWDDGRWEDDVGDDDGGNERGERRRERDGTDIINKEGANLIIEGGEM